MEVIGLLIGLLLLGVVVVLFAASILIPVFGILEIILAPVGDYLIYLRYKLFPFRVPPSLIRTLAVHCDYYINLNRSNKREFEKRCLLFLKSKRFVAGNDLTPTETMMALIAAAAIQLTFGLSYFRLKYFHKIFVYPDVYQYRSYQSKFRGHVSNIGTIHLSWKHFEKGYLFPDDGVNLGLHEMAHALKLEALQERVDFKFYENHETWEKLVKLELSEIKNSDGHLFREYATRNLEELWAVCIECFFELPEKFQKELPELYQHMKRTLNQDPLKKSNPVLGPY